MLVRSPILLATVALFAAMWGLSVVGEGDSWVRGTDKPGAVKILQFYATAGAVVPGESAKLCYGVANAKIVRISPLLPNVYPSPGRCIEVVPDHTTHYTILAVGFDGATAIRSLTLPVQDPPPAPSQTFHVADMRKEPQPLYR